GVNLVDELAARSGSSKINLGRPFGAAYVDERSEAVRNLSSCVRARIVHNDDFYGPITLVSHRLQTKAEKAGGVTGRDDDRNQRGIAVSFRGRLAQSGEAAHRR